MFMSDRRLEFLFNIRKGQQQPTLKRSHGTIVVMKNGQKMTHAFCFSSEAQKQQNLIKANKYVLDYVAAGHKATYQVYLFYGIPLMDLAGVLA